jgi:hypothetical protein
VWAEQWGLGEFELSPEAFWSLTVREFWIKFAAFQRRENRAMHRLARLALLTTRYKTEVRHPEQLVGSPSRYPMKAWLVDGQGDDET